MALAKGMDGQGPPKVPRWVKVVGIVAGVVLLLAIAALAFGGGQHGPGRHFSSQSGNSHGSNHTPPSGNGTSISHHTMESPAAAPAGWLSPVQVQP